MAAETTARVAGHWRGLSSEERLKDPEFAAHVAASRAACGLPPRVADPVALSSLAVLMKVDDTYGAAGESEAA